MKISLLTFNTLLQHTRHNLSMSNQWVIDGYSQLFLNGHLYKTDTWCWSRPLLSHFTITTLYKTDTSIRRTTDTLKLSTDTCEVLNVTVNVTLFNTRRLIDSSYLENDILFQKVTQAYSEKKFFFRVCLCHFLE